MANISRYEVIYANSETAFNEQINTMIKQGWQPQGGISVSFQHNGQFQQTIYHQAMVTYEKERLLTEEMQDLIRNIDNNTTHRYPGGRPLI